MDTIDGLVGASQGYRDVLREYCVLAMQPTLEDKQANRMEEILELAQADSLLSFLIDEADHILGHELGLIDAVSTHNQQHQLRQALDRDWINIHVEKSRLREGQVPVLSLKEAQTRLRAEGLYTGFIDGVYGPKTKQAFQSLRQKLQNNLKKQGLYTGSIDETCSSEHQQMVQILTEKGHNIDAEKVELLNLETWFLRSC